MFSFSIPGITAKSVETTNGQLVLTAEYEDSARNTPFVVVLNQSDTGYTVSV